MYTLCIINIQVPHEVKNLRALTKRPSQIMKYGQNVVIDNPKWTDIKYNWKWY